MSFELVSPAISILFTQSVAVVLGFLISGFALYKSRINHSLWMVVITLALYFVFFTYSFHQFNFFITILSVNIFLGFLLFNLEKAFFLLSVSTLFFTLELVVYEILWSDYSISQYFVNLLNFSIYAFLALFLKSFLNKNKDLIKSLSLSLSRESALNDAIVESISSGIFFTTDDKRFNPLNAKAKTILKNHNNFNNVLQHVDKNHLYNSYEVSLKNKIYKVSESELNSSAYKNGKVYLVSDETEIKKIEKELEQVRKLAAVGTLSAGLAHEIRNPLAGMSGSLELLKENQEDQKTQEKLFTTVLREIDRLNALVTDFLDFSKPTVNKNDKVEFSQFFEDTLSIVKKDPSAKKVKIVSQVETGTIQADESKLKQVFMNILLNSFQAFDIDRVTDLENQNELPKVLIQGRNLGQKYSLSISDNGVGIPKDELNKIFEPFHTTKDKGTGLGLALSHRILSEHEATVSVDSVEDQGTVFEITFKL